MYIHYSAVGCDFVYIAGIKEGLALLRGVPLQMPILAQSTLSVWAPETF